MIGLTPVPATAHRLAVVWGIQSYLTSDPDNPADMVRKAPHRLRGGLRHAGRRAFITAGVPIGSASSTNMIRIAFIGENGEPVSESR